MTCSSARHPFKRSKASGKTLQVAIPLGSSFGTSSEIVPLMSMREFFKLSANWGEAGLPSAPYALRK